MFGAAVAALAVPVAMALTAMPALAATPPPAGYAAMKPAITLTLADNGRHVRAHRGERINVRLSVDPSWDPSIWWRPIDEDGRALRARPQTLFAMRGTTLGRYTAVARGEATLSSARAACPQTSNGTACHAMLGWSVTVDVR